MTNLGYTPEEPIAAIATAIAPAAIGIVRTSGTGCISLMERLFSRPRALRNAAGYTLVHGWLVAPGTGHRIDEVLLGVYKAPRSFTGEDMVEVFCHGGVSVVLAVHRLLLENGFRQAERGEFTFRAYIHGKTDLTRAEAVREIIESKTDASRSHAAGRLAGSLYDEIRGITQLLVSTLAAIEVAVEYPEDEETISDTYNDAPLCEARNRLAALADSWRSEKLYQDGARVVLCGRTNAGKSSLFNALLKEDRAIVSNVEGTTRDWLESWADFGGIPVRLFDTAGLRQTADVVEAAGVERTVNLSTDADMVLYVVDSRTGITAEDEQFLAELSAHGTPRLIVWNKSDTVKNATGSAFSAPVPPDGSGVGPVHTSAKTGAGLGDLTTAVARALGMQDTTGRNQAGLGSARQKAAVTEALERVDHARTAAAEYGTDAVVQDIEDALDALGAVTGDVTPDDILESIFSQFCVGK